ncbi:hypothetical protein ACFL0X_02965 [Nanoarchaeota archaeon]
MESVGVGYGRVVTLRNIWVPKININELDFLIEYDFDELDKENNLLKLKIKE